MTLRKKVTTAIQELAESSEPRDLGTFKSGPLRGYYAYELGLECRILYDVDSRRKIIRFHRVCSHKEVYGP